MNPSAPAKGAGGFKEPKWRIRKTIKQQNKMKKLSITLAILIGFGMTTLANPIDGGLFQRGASEPEASAIYGVRSEGMPKLPNHAQTENQDAPLGSGLVVLLGLGVAYGVSKKCRDD